MHKGSKHTVESRIKISVAIRGRRLTLEHSAKISAAQRARNPLGLLIWRGRALVRLFPGEKWLKRAHVIWVQHNGPIPDPGFGRHGHQFCIHHEDGNKLNDAIENLQCWSNADHSRHHNLKYNKN